jgi:tetratricopeptide (TPR) repeat protein
MVLLAGAALWACPASAADALKFGPAPSWVHPQSIPPAKATEAPVALLLNDQQIALQRGKVTTYSEGAIKIENAQGLAAGNLALVWQPATDTVTVNKLQIIRGDKVIDVLASGQTFTVLRRETNLDAATLDGTLTATIQPEGLQEGDIIDLATTIERSDPVLKGHVEAMFGAWDGVPIQLAHSRISWPSDLHINVRETPNLPPAERSSSNGTNVLELTGHDVDPLVPPKGAPERFRIGRLAEATDFSSWSDVADLFIPLFRDASTIPGSGALHDEVEKIRASSADPKIRAGQALELVQDRVRYVGLLMGEGGYVPAPAEMTWSRRFGDCKAKTALLLGVLHALGIEAEPVLVQSKIGDMLADRLPMIGLFNHVLVRAHVGGHDYWLDGTRTGDTDLDAIQVPDFGWGLPVVDHAQLVRLVPGPLEVPTLEHVLDIDASAGIYAPAATTIHEIYHGDPAVALNTIYSALAPDQRDQQMHDEAKSYFDSFEIGSSALQFDKTKRELDITIKGNAKLNWKDGWAYVPTSSIGFDPDFDRAPGPLHDVPMAITHPRYVKDRVTIHLPPGFAAQQKLWPKVDETLAGVEYARSETVAGDTLTIDSSERSLVAEVPYKEALAAAARLKALDNDDVYLKIVSSYSGTDRDLAAKESESPGSASDYVARGSLLIDHGKFDEAIADFSKALQVDPRNVAALASRGVASASKNDYAAAEKDLSAAEAIDPGSASLLTARAFMLERKGDIPSAIEGYTKALQKDPLNAFALFRRALLYRSDWKYDAAVKDLTEILTHDARNVSALSFRALTYAAMGNSEAAQRDLAAARSIAPTDGSVTYAEAQLARTDRDSGGEIAAYSKLLQTAPAKGPILQERASVYLRLNRYDEALADTDEALKLGYREIDLRLLRANIFMRRGERQSVKAEADAMISENPQSSYAFIAAGKTYQALGLQSEALKAIDRALAMQPDVMGYLNRADIRPFSDIEGRLSDIDSALKLEPNNADALEQKAYNLMLKGDYAQALKIYDRAAQIDVDPNGKTIPLGRAVAFYRSGQQAQAKQVLSALRSKAKSAGDFDSLCWTEARWNMFVDQAVSDCKEALKVDPKTSTDDEGFALLRTGRLDEAIADFDKAIAQSHAAFSYMARAIAYQRKGMAREANADRAEALKLKPDTEAMFAEYGLTMGPQPGTSSSAAH